MKKELMSAHSVIKYMREVILSTHEVKQIKNSFDYEGEEVSCSYILCSDFNIKETFTEDLINYYQEHGDDFLTVILRKTFQLGYEQAVRKHKLE